MSKNLTEKQWLRIIKMYKNNQMDLAIENYIRWTGRKNIIFWQLRNRIKNKSKMLDNQNMKKVKTIKSKKRDDSDIPNIVNELTIEQLKEIANDWIKN